jgi:hypothetical protein
MKSILLLITPLEAGIDLKYLVILSPGTISHTFITAGNTRLSLFWFWYLTNTTIK